MEYYESGLCDVSYEFEWHIYCAADVIYVTSHSL